MDIDYNGPTALVFDVSSLIGTLDRDGLLSPLAWQYVAERDLVEKAGFTVVSTIPRCPSLDRQYRLIRSLLDRCETSFVEQLDRRVVMYLRQYVVSMEMTNETLIIFKRKTLSWE